jgi:mRNA interferase MazF
VKRGDVRLAQVGQKVRPVVVLTRDAVIDVRSRVTVAEVTTTIRGLAAEVPIDDDVGLDRPSVVNCDVLHTVPRAALTRKVGGLDDDAMRHVCWAVHYALGC